MQEGSPEPSNPIIRHQGDLSITWHGKKKRGPAAGESVPDTPAKSRCVFAHPNAPARQSRAGEGPEMWLLCFVPPRRSHLSKQLWYPPLRPIPSSSFATHSRTDSPGIGSV